MANSGAKSKIGDSTKGDLYIGWGSETTTGGILELKGANTSLDTWRTWAYSGRLNVTNAATLNVGAGGLLIGGLKAFTGRDDTSFVAAVGGAVNGVNASLSVAGQLAIGGDGAGQLDIQEGGFVSANVLAVNKNGALNLQGGTLTVGTVGVNAGGSFSFSAGTLNYTGGDISTANFFGNDGVLGSGQTFNVTGKVNVAGGDRFVFAGGALKAMTFQVDSGGEASVGRSSLLNPDNLLNYGHLTLDGGTVNGSFVNAGSLTG